MAAGGEEGVITEGLNRSEEVMKGGEEVMKGGEEGIDGGEEACGAFRVRLQSKREVREQMEVYKELLERSLDGQNGLPEEKKRVFTLELLQNFEAAVCSNVLVNGVLWAESPDADAEEQEEALDLESLLDDAIVETARRRRAFPKHVLFHIVQQLKAQRRALGLYEERFTAERLSRDQDQDELMEALKAAAPAAVRRAVSAIQSISLLQHQSSGLLQVVNMKSSQTSSLIHQEVLGPAPPPEAPPTSSRRPVKRVVMETAAAAAYRPLAKKPQAE